jgi:two-component system, NtrC family, sensor kinase
MKFWQRGSIAQAMLLAFLVVAIVPLVVFAAISINQSSNALTRQMEENLNLVASAKADEINIRLTEVLHNTQIATRHAELVLGSADEVPVSPEALARYQPDDRSILGLDVFYNAQGGEAALGTTLSNVYLDGSLDPTSSVARDILATEQLDPIFESIKQVSPDTQWIYLTTPDGMMRLYPWASNDHYPDKWDPRTIIFYTVAEPGVNPTLEPRWTPPYVDYAGAGWMVTVSIPIVDDEGQFLGIMSHDVTIESLKKIALDINVLEGAGYGFLIDQTGSVIAHPDYQDDDASKGTQEAANLLQSGSNDEYRAFIQQMVNGAQGSGYFTDEAGEEQLLVYAPVPTIGWSLGVVVPRTAVIQPATDMRSRVLLVTLLIIVLAVALAILLTRLIHQPLLKLLQGVYQVTEERENRADVVEVHSFTELSQLAQAFNEMATNVWERESRLKEKVAKLSIEIDAKRQQAEVEGIVETDYFKELERNAERLRANLNKQSA